MTFLTATSVMHSADNRAGCSSTLNYIMVCFIHNATAKDRKVLNINLFYQTDDYHVQDFLFS